MRAIAATVASPSGYELGEGPFWDAERDRLLWVDIAGGMVLRGRLVGDHLEVETEFTLPPPVAAAVPTADDGLLVALRAGVATVADDGTVRTGAPVLPEGVDSRFNDGACDPAGRFLVGSMSLDDREQEERLYRIDGAASVEVVDGGLTLSNGLGWSPDGRTLYHVDSAPGIVWSRTYDVSTGAMGPRRQHLRIDDGTPDGMCVDTDGNLWIAVYGAGEVRCFDAGGEQLATVDVAAPHTTSVAFVGPALDRLLITSAREGLSAAELDEHPLSGHLFLADVGAHGVPAAAWAGRCTDIAGPYDSARPGNPAP
jgi:sugar lactone lactonase YvrE